MRGNVDISAAYVPSKSAACGEADLSIGGVCVSQLAVAGEMLLPKVSFIVRNWNYGRYIGRTIQSIQAQDYPNFEAIIVDNASTDDSRDVIEHHAKGDPRFRVIHSDANLGPLGGGILGLKHATGDFIAFIDSDDTLLSHYASVHIQVHLASPRNVAFTSSSAIETGPDGTTLNGRRAGADARREHVVEGLLAPEIVPRLRTVHDDAYATLSRHTRLLQPVAMEWPWSPGTSNMYRRFILDLLAPACDSEDLPKLSADGHFNHLGHLLGGSARIDIPLSTYRIHGGNFSASVPSLSYLGSDSGPATRFHAIRMREALRVYVGNAADFSTRMGEKRYWEGLIALIEMGGLGHRADLAEWKRGPFFDEQIQHLARAFGERRAIRNLAALMPKKMLRESLHVLHGPNLPPRARLELHLGALRHARARIKRGIRKWRMKQETRRAHSS